MQQSTLVIPKKDWGFNGTGRLAAYALVGIYGASRTDVAYYDENFRSIGRTRSNQGAGQSFADILTPAANTSTFGGMSISFLGSSQTTQSSTGSSATSNWLNAAAASGEFSNAMVDIFSDGLITSAQARGDTADNKHYLNTAAIPSDHTDRSIVYLLADGKLRATSRLNGQYKYGRAGTTDFAVPNLNAN
jgi:hypothetical protein